METLLFFCCFFFQFVVLQMHSILFELQTFIDFALSFLKVSSTYLRTAKALARLCLCAVSPEPLLVAYVISILFSCAGPNLIPDSL